MSFYSEPAFFVAVAILAVPGILMGLAGRSSKCYGLAVSVVMLVALFCRDVPGALAFGAFLAISCATTAATLHWFRTDNPHAVALYRCALVVALLPLVCAKVSAVFDTNVLGFLGISYLTFKSVQVLIEIRDGLIKKMSPLDYLYFLLFFPVFTSGPIMRSRDFVKQINEPLSRDAYLDLLARGIGWFVLGILYSFVLAMFFQWLQWFGPSALGTDGAGIVAGQLVQCICYGLYLFFDFAGYSFMAMGIGAALGIRVPTNFRRPFLSVDIKDFWNRWHITLSYWLRDFVFMRVSRAFRRHKVFKSRLTTACVSFIINMGVMGFWHGLTIDFIAYGFYHGFLLAICELFQKKSKLYKNHHEARWFKVCSWAITMIAVFFGFAIFSGQVSSLILGAVNG